MNCLLKTFLIASFFFCLTACDETDFFTLAPMPEPNYQIIREKQIYAEYERKRHYKIVQGLGGSLYRVYDYQ